MKLILQVSSRTESFNATPVMGLKGPQYYLRVQVRGEDFELKSLTPCPLVMYSSET